MSCASLRLVPLCLVVLGSPQVVGRELLVRFISYLCNNTSDPMVNLMLETTDIQILPALNLDGYVHALMHCRVT